MGTAATNRRLRVILTELRDGKLVPNPAFQRRLVWSTKHKVKFLETVLEGLPFPEVFIAAGEVNPDTGEGQELIVDGQQRLTTLFKYFTASPDLKLGNALPPYVKLESAQKLAFLEYEVVVRDLGSLTDEETRDLFWRINSTSYGLNAMEVNNARFDGALKRFCDDLSENSFFSDHRTFNSFDVKRMSDVRWCLTLVITMLSTYFNRDVDHEVYLEKYNDDFPQEAEIRHRLDAVFAYIKMLEFVPSCRMWQKSDLFTLMVELDRLRDSIGSLAIDDVRDRLQSFYENVDRVASGDLSLADQRAVDYFAAARSGSNDRSSRVRRGEIVNAIIRM
jgi:hypothetical protein